MTTAMCETRAWKNINFRKCIQIIVKIRSWRSNNVLWLHEYLKQCFKYYMSVNEAPGNFFGSIKCYRWRRRPESCIYPCHLHTQYKSQSHALIATGIYYRPIHHCKLSHVHTICKGTANKKLIFTVIILLNWGTDFTGSWVFDIDGHPFNIVFAHMAPWISTWNCSFFIVSMCVDLWYLSCNPV